MNILANPIHLANLERSYLWLAKKSELLHSNSEHPPPHPTRHTPLTQYLQSQKLQKKNSDFLKSVVQMTVPLC